MRKILITGEDSYIGEAVRHYLSQWPDEYRTDCISVRTKEWQKTKFSEYDSVFHVAGIAHVKETKENRALFEEVNHKLAVSVAEKAKEEGVKQFIFVSSMSVYGIDTGEISADTRPKPQTNYALSKYRAENDLCEMESEGFRVCILRPPMVYGKECKGNFQSVIKIVRHSVVFPKVNNTRSLIHIDNLCSFVKICIDRGLSGIHRPQNDTYMNTTEMACLIAEAMHKRLWVSGTLGIVIKLMMPFSRKARKAFGSLTYIDADEPFSYCVHSSEDSVKRSV